MLEWSIRQQKMLQAVADHNVYIQLSLYKSYGT